MLTMGHLIAVIILGYHFRANVLAGLPSNPTILEYNDAENDLKKAWIVALIMFIFDFFGLFGGFSIFFRSVNLFQIIIHFIGALYTTWFILNEWNYKVYWYIVVFCSIFPAFIEFCVLISIFVLKIVRY